MPELKCAPFQADWPPKESPSVPSRRKPAQILAFVNQKGGTGKTTAAQNLAICFGLHHDKRVLCVDLDPQGNLGQGLIGDQVSTAKTADRLLVVPKVNIDEYIIPVRHGVDLIYNNFHKEVREAVDRLPLSPGLLRRQLNPALTRYDYVIIDTPAGLCRSTQFGVDAADQVILVVSCGMYGLKGMVAVMDWMHGIYNRLTRPMPSIKVVLNNYDERRRFDREFKEEVHNIFGDALYQTRIRTSTRIVEAAAHGIAVLEFDPVCSVAADFIRLSREVLCLPPCSEPVVEFVSESELQEREFSLVESDAA